MHVNWIIWALLSFAIIPKTSVEWVDSFMTLLCHRFRFSIDLILVRELTLYTLLRPTPYIVILIFRLTCRKFAKDGARGKEIICFY